MKKMMMLLALTGCIVSCSKEELSKTPASTTSYTMRVVAIDNDGTKNYTSIARVQSGKVGIEFETADVSNVKSFGIEVSGDGNNFRQVKTIPADLTNPNKIYRDTLILE